MYISEVIDISPTNLIPDCASSNPAFLMMYSAYKLNKLDDNMVVLVIIVDIQFCKWKYSNKNMVIPLPWDFF